MEIVNIKALKQLNVENNHIACIGYFDGIHRGHQELIKEVVALAKINNCIPACICFDQDPWLVSKKISVCKHLTPLEERIKLIASMGIEKCFLLHFDEAMMKLEKEQFINQILNHLNLHTLVCGSDFTFAYKGIGKVKDLEKHSFHLKVVKELQYDGKKIASSAIEKLIKEGHIVEANRQLGRYYQIPGIVIHGANVGAIELGFPTANLKVMDEYVLPKKGVYVGSAKVGLMEYKAMINVGYNPTLNKQSSISIEAYLLDFNCDIYGKEVIFCFIDYIRSEIKFSSKNALIKQLQSDANKVREYRKGGV